MPLALFVVLGLAALALVMGRMTATSFGGVVQQGISTQSYYAARSATEIALHRLLFAESDINKVQARCSALDAQEFAFSLPGLDRCSAKVMCLAVAEADAILTLDVTSTGQCGSGSLNASRTVAYRIQVSDRDFNSAKPGSESSAGQASLASRIVFKKELLR